MWSGTISFHCIANAESWRPEDYTTHVGLTVSIFQWCRSMTSLDYVFQLPSGFRNRVEDRLSFIPVRKTQAGARRLASRPASLSAIR
jgi:hypothetical protein